MRIIRKLTRGDFVGDSGVAADEAVVDYLRWRIVVGVVWIICLVGVTGVTIITTASTPGV